MSTVYRFVPAGSVPTFDISFANLRATGSKACISQMYLTHLRASRYTNLDGLAAEAEDAFDGLVAPARDLDHLDY